MQSKILIMILFCLTNFTFLSCSKTQKTEIIIIGTFHGNHATMLNYHFGTLKYFLEITKPDVLAVEIRPNDLKNKNFDVTPQDIAKIVIPWANEKKIPLYGIDWWKDNSRQEYNQFMAKLEKTEEGRKKLAKSLDELEIHADRFKNVEDMTAKYIHSQEFADKDHKVRQNATQLFGEGPGNLFWYTRAAEMNKLLNQVILEHKGKRIVVVTGAAHRGDFEQFLREKNNVTLIPLKSIKGFDQQPSYETYLATCSKDELKEMLFATLQGMRANQNPDSVNLQIAKKVLDQFRSLSKENGYIDFFEGEYNYLSKNYLIAKDYFKKAQDELKREKIYGMSLSDFAKIRMAMMMDLLKERKSALIIYKKLSQEKNRIGEIAKRFLNQDFKRP